MITAQAEYLTVVITELHADHMTSPQSTAPFSLEYLEKIIDRTSSMERKLMKTSDDQLTYRQF